MGRQVKRLVPERKKASYDKGFEHGWRDGAAEAIQSAITPFIPPVRSLRVLYVPQGFPGIDKGIIEALRMSVHELNIAQPEQMLEMAINTKPDVMIVLNGLHTFPPNHLEQAEAVRALGVRTAIWFADDPYFTELTGNIALHYDMVFTHELAAVKHYKTLGCPFVMYMPLGANLHTFRPMAVGHKYRSDVCFIGQGFWNRIELFDAVAARLVKHRVVIAGGLWERLRNQRLLKPSIRSGWTPVEEAVKYYNGAKVVINIHRTTEAGKDNQNSFQLPGRSINPRTFEIASCGTLQLTDVREDLTRYYLPGTEIATFAGAADLIEKIEYYIAREEERRKIAMHGLARTLREHSYTVRIHKLLELMGY